MTIKEITALRKSGKLDEALDAAEQEFALNANNYTASALFWCLNDVCKKEQEHDVIISLFERMKSLCEYCPDDEYLAKSIIAIKKRLDPLAVQIGHAIELAKSGFNDEDLLRNLKASFDSHELSASLYSDYGWLVYYALKNTPVNDSMKRKQLLFDYFQLELPRPDVLHSRILAEAVKVEKNTPLQFRIRDFMKLWGWDNIRDDDWQQFKTDNGNIMSSLVEKLISVFAKEIKTDGVPSPEEFDELVDKALIMYPANQYMPFYKATILKSMGKNTEALDYFRKLILKSPSKFYLWHQASALEDDIELRISLLCKAISVEKEESFIGKCRLDLANALIGKRLYSNAKYELDKYRNFYMSQGWSLRQEYLDLEHMIAQGTVSESNQQMYKMYIEQADEFIYRTIPSVLAIKVADKLVDDRNRSGKKLVQWTLRTKGGILSLRKPARFGLENRIPNGSAFDIKIHENRIVWIGKSTQNPLEQDWIKKAEDGVKLRTDRKGKVYAILGNAYIGAKLLAGIQDGDCVKIIALKQEDERWSAISLKKV